MYSIIHKMTYTAKRHKELKTICFTKCIQNPFRYVFVCSVIAIITIFGENFLWCIRYSWESNLNISNSFILFLFYMPFHIPCLCDTICYRVFFPLRNYPPYSSLFIRHNEDKVIKSTYIIKFCLHNNDNRPKKLLPFSPARAVLYL